MSGGAAPQALATGPVMLADADGKRLLTAVDKLKSGRDLIQSPFGNLPTISEKVRTVHSILFHGMFTCDQ